MSQLTVQQAFDLATRRHQEGRLLEAEQLYRQILARQPDHTDSMLRLGLIARKAGRNDVAIQLIRQSIALNPNVAEAHNNLGNALNDTGQLDEAIAAYRQAIALNPDLPETHFNLGNTLHHRAKRDDAIAAYRRAIALRPNYAEAFNNLGNALKDSRQFDAAITAYRHAILLRPDYAEACNNLAGAFMDNGQIDDSLAAYRHAIALKPDYAEAHFNLGIALKDLPGGLDHAINDYRRAIALKPDYADACNNLGNALKDAGLLDDALAAYRRAIAINPNVPQARHNLLYSLYFHPALDAAAILSEHRRWNDASARPLAAHIRPHDNDRSPDRPRRIGYVSGDFRQHVIARNLLPVLQHHDRSQFTIHCYSNTKRTDDFTDPLRKSADGWRDIVGIGDDEAADLIRADRIDILIDASLHLAGNRLLVFARNPAPVQVTWLGYPGTTGMDAIDYRLTDPHLDPPGLDDANYSEKSVRLPDSFWCYDSLGEEPPISPPPCRQNGFVTFGCLNNFCKINDPVLSLWADVLNNNAGSHLLCMAPEGSCRQRMLAHLAGRGVEAARIEFVSSQDRPIYLRLYDRIDIGLDTFPYNGHTTSLDSYFMGVPVITLVGKTVVGRAGVSQLSNLGLADLITHTPGDFVRIAVQLATDRPRLADLRATLRERMRNSPLMDAPRFTRGLEAAYRAMWRNWTAGA
jgi:protein O-GlcNAc transferase